MAFDTFDTDSVVTAGMTFTNGNLTAQGGSGVTLAFSNVAQAVEGKKSGKWYAEFTCVAVSGNVDGVGVVNSWGLMGQATSSAAFIGGQSDAAPGGPFTGDIGWGYYTNSHVSHFGTTQSSVNQATWGAGNVIGIAIDLDNQRVWWRVDTGNWVGTSGTPNPATNTSGFDISHLLGNNCRVYPGVNLSGSAAKFTANFGASAFTGAVPSGFTSGWTNTTVGTYFGTFACSGRGGGGSGSGVSAPPANDKAVSKYTSTFTGAFGSLIFPFAGNTITACKGVVYDTTGAGGLPGALLGVSTNIVTSAYGERTFTFSGVNLVNGTSYWFGLDSSGGDGIALCPIQTGGIAFNSGPYPTPSDPFGASPSQSDFRYPMMMFPGASNANRHQIRYY